MKTNEILSKLETSIYNSIQVSFNSEGRIMTKKELKPRVRSLCLLSLNFAIGEAQKNNLSTLEYIEAKDILMSQI